jgi:hypothetical protein
MKHATENSTNRLRLGLFSKERKWFDGNAETAGTFTKGKLRR